MANDERRAGENEKNDEIEENDEDDRKIAVITLMTTMWIDGGSFAFCPQRKSVDLKG